MVKFYEGLYDELSLYVRHCAWLNAVPEKIEGDKSTKPELSRRAALKKDGVEEPEMPPCEAQHIVGYLFEMGPTLSAGMGEGPLTHGEIAAWQSNTGIELNAWEARIVRRLSQEYVRESQKATERDCSAPWAAAPYAKPTADRVAASLKASMYELREL